MSLVPEEMTENPKRADPGRAKADKRLFLVAVARIATAICGTIVTAAVVRATGGPYVSFVAMFGFMAAAIVSVVLTTMDDGKTWSVRIPKSIAVVGYLVSVCGLVASVVYVPEYHDGISTVVIGRGRTNIGHGFFANALSGEFRRLHDFDACVTAPTGVTPQGESVSAKILCARFRLVADEGRLERLADSGDEGMEAVRAEAEKRLAEIFAAVAKDGRPLLKCTSDDRIPEGGEETKDVQVIEPTPSERGFAADGPPIELDGRLGIRGPRGPWKVMF